LNAMSNLENKALEIDIIESCFENLIKKYRKGRKSYKKRQRKKVFQLQN
jgi:hypothetical protein